MKSPVRPKRNEWSLDDVLEHLKFAVNLEMWTIPYYMTVMYSIKDSSAPAFRLIQSIANQEMLHAQLAANVYNSFSFQRPKPERLELGPYLYTKKGGVPHIQFEKDPDALTKYGKPDAELGGLDCPRVNTMCLIELPENEPPSFDPNSTEYASIGDLYTALRFGMQQQVEQVVGNHRQVDYFKNFYGHLTQSTVTADGHAGLAQAFNLIELITEQGEGRCKVDEALPVEFQNTADGYNPSWNHFRKFNAIRDGLLTGNGPEIYQADPTQQNTEPQEELVHNFSKLCMSLEAQFNGEESPDFGALMPTVGANIHTCWRSGVIPQYPVTRETGGAKQ